MLIPGVVMNLGCAGELHRRGWVVEVKEEGGGG